MPSDVYSRGLKFVSAWKELYIDAGDYTLNNLLMPLWFCALGFVVISLSVLWTRYGREERWAWFVMLIILLCCVFPSNVLPLLPDMQAQSFEWSAWFG
jgi:cytochrome bd-type quinol oxidase subunit 2